MKKKSRKLVGKTIVQLVPALNHGGAERGTVEMSEAIIRAGGRAVVISKGGFFESNLLRLGAEHITLDIKSKNPLRILFNRRRLKSIFAEIKPDLVHVRSRVPAWSAMGVGQQLKIPMVTTIHGTWSFRGMSTFKRFYNGIMFKSNYIIAVSHYIAGLVKEQNPDVIDRMSVVHRGVDLDMFNPKTISRHRIVKMAEHLALPDAVPIIMLPSRPSAQKGTDILIEAMGVLKDRDFLLLLVGAGDGNVRFQNNLVSKISNADLMDKVRLIPSISDMPSALMLADVVVMPSTIPEPFGRVAVEASAMGCPVVAFNHGGAKESIIHGVTGWLADAVEEVSLAEAMSTALSLKKRERQKLAEDARAHVEKNFSSEKMCKSTIDVYLKLMK